MHVRSIAQGPARDVHRAARLSRPAAPDDQAHLSAGAAAEMILFKQNVKEIKGPLEDYLESHVKAAHHRTFE